MRLQSYNILRFLRLLCVGFVLIFSASDPVVAQDEVHWQIDLDEVLVKEKKEHYTKHNNPAVALIDSVRRTRDINDPRRHDNYSYMQYERINVALNNVSSDDEQSGLLKKFPFLREYVDTSAVTGRPILNISVKEKMSTIYYRHHPESEKEYVTGIARAGIDEMVDQESMQTLLNDVLREVDIYDADINILQNRFVSPLSPLAPDFYKFYLGDTVSLGGERCVRVSFVPRNNRMFGFTGSLFVAVDDPTFFVKRVTMNVAKAINLNFIDHLELRQEYERGADGSRYKLSDEMAAEVSVIKGTQGLALTRETTYGGHNHFASPHPELFDKKERVIVSPHAHIRDEAFWADGRMGVVAGGDTRKVSEMMTRLRGSAFYYWSEKILKVIVTGYINTGNPSKFDIGPVNTLVSTDNLEGVRLRVGGMTTANLSRRWFARGYLAYGFKDKKFKYKGELEYSFNDKQYHSREFAMHSLRLTHLYDIDQIGQHYMFTNMDNIFLSLKRLPDKLITYHRVTQLDYTLELQNNFSVVATLFNRRQEATANVPFVMGNGTAVGHYNESGVSLQLRYAPGEKFYQTKSSRIPINLDAPVIVLTHEYSPAGVFGNTFEVNKTELSMQKRFWFSAWGFTDVILKGGHVWSRSAFPDLLIPNANLSYTIQPESFALMSPMEFVYDTYGSWDVTYWANGAIFNYIPLLKSLKLREVFACRGTWGKLSDRNNPLVDRSLYVFPEGAMRGAHPDEPYVEVSAGLDNIFKCLRVDYVWRLTHRHTPGVDHSGVRMAFHVTF